MTWIEKGQSASFEHEPIEGLYFIDGDAVAALIKPDWTKGEKLPKIAFPSGQDFDIWEGSGSPIIHILQLHRVVKWIKALCEAEMQY